MLRIADERRLPLEVRAQNGGTRRASAELEQGNGKRLASAEALFDDVGI